MMKSFDTRQPAFRIIQRLARLRRESPAVQRGPYHQKFCDDDRLVYQRREDNDVVVVAVNRGSATTIEVEGLDLPDAGIRTCCGCRVQARRPAKPSPSCRGRGKCG